MKPIYTLIALLLSTLIAHTQWQGFQPIKSYSVSEDSVNLIHTKDITGDGVPDLTVLYNAIKTNWGILDGKGNGQFKPIRSFTKEDNYFLSDIADFNRDGFPDIVISSYWNNGFLIYYGQRSGQFTKGPYLFTGIHGRAVKCVDINKDGITDIVTTTSGSGRTIHLHVFLGKGDGSFHDKKTFPSVLDTCKEIFVTDKNNDGLLDIVSSSAFPWLVIFVQKEDGSFEATYHPTFHTAQAAFSDVNQDGKEDLLLLYASFDNMPDSDSMIIKLNNGADYHSPSIRVPSFENRKIRPYRLRVADINKDGFDDLFFNHADDLGELTDTLFYILGKGGTQYGEPVPITMPARARYFALDDLNRDGWTDLVVSCDNGTVNVLLSRSKTSQQESRQVHIYPNPAAKHFFIEMPAKTAHTIQLYNAAGQLVQRQVTTATKIRMYTYSLPAGLYYINIKGKEVNERQAILLH
jgi:hypothetical protein